MMNNWQYTASTAYTVYKVPRIRYVDFRLGKTHDKTVLWAKSILGKWHYVFLDRPTPLNNYDNPAKDYINYKADSSILHKLLNNDINVWGLWPEDFLKDMLEYLVNNA